MRRRDVAVRRLRLTLGARLRGLGLLDVHHRLSGARHRLGLGLRWDAGAHVAGRLAAVDSLLG